jgi:large subunit ribosomal protein L4
MKKKLSVASLITEKNKDKNLLILNDFSSEIKKTKEMNAIIQKLEIPNSLIILDKASKEKIEKSARNIPNVKVTDVNHFSSYDIIKFKKVVFTESSVKELKRDIHKMDKIHLYDKIVSPMVTEKSTNLSEQNKIVF